MPSSANPNRFWIWIYASIGVVMTTAVLVFTWVSIQSREENTTGTAGGPVQHQTKQIPPERYQMLARFEAPPYAGGSKSQAFTEAMKRYTERDYPAAASLLRGIDSADGHFYRGISLLLAGKAAEGNSELRSAIRIDDSPYNEQAHLYLAKSLLAHGEITEARNELQQVIAARGPLQIQAKALVAALVEAK